MEETVKGKCDYITAINRLMCLCVVLVHIGLLSNTIFNIVFSSIYGLTYASFTLLIVMPFFFYKSGAFSEHNGTVRAKHYWRKYIRPFAIYGAIGMAVQFLVTCFGYGVSCRQWLHDLIRTACVTNTVFGNVPLWFLLTLFLVRCASDYILPKVHPLIVAMLSIGFAYLHFRLATPKTPFILGNFFSGMCFYSLGYYMKKHEDKNWMMALSFVVYVGYFILVAFTSLKISFPVYQSNTIFHGENYLIIYPLGFFGIIATKAAFRWLSKHYSFPVLSYIGRNAMNFYVTHWIVLVVVKFVAEKHFGILGTKLCFYLFVAVCALTLPLISKLINSIKEKKVCTTTSRQEGC